MKNTMIIAAAFSQVLAASASADDHTTSESRARGPVATTQHVVASDRVSPGYPAPSGLTPFTAESGPRANSGNVIRETRVVTRYVDVFGWAVPRYTTNRLASDSGRANATRESYRARYPVAERYRTEPTVGRKPQMPQASSVSLPPAPEASGGGEAKRNYFRFANLRAPVTAGTRDEKVVREPSSAKSRTRSPVFLDSRLIARKVF